MSPCWISLVYIDINVYLDQYVRLTGAVDRLRGERRRVLTCAILECEEAKGMLFLVGTTETAACATGRIRLYN